MANNEEKRILVLEADKSNLNQFIFDLSWKHLDKVKGNEISRAEAIERMAKAINKERCRPALKEDVYWQEDKEELLREAKAALDALLGKEAKNE
mgnify:CR=1 FL=1